jgi:hypothetical protein
MAERKIHLVLKWPKLDFILWENAAMNHFIQRLNSDDG